MMLPINIAIKHRLQEISDEITKMWEVIVHEDDKKQSILCMMELAVRQMLNDDYVSMSGIGFIITALEKIEDPKITTRQMNSLRNDYHKAGLTIMPYLDATMED